MNKAIKIFKNKAQRWAKKEKRKRERERDYIQEKSHFNRATPTSLVTSAVRFWATQG